MERVYLSSTFQDLREHREAVRLQLQRLHLDDVAMEVYVAEPNRPVDRCIRDVRSCDLYIGLFAWRYGHIPKGHDRSITEIEYRTAVEHGKDRLIFLLHEDAPWPRSAMERGSGADRIEALRAELAEEHLSSFFSSVEELATLVTTAVAKWLVARRPDPGGIGAITPQDRDQAAPDTIALEELAGYRRRLQRYARLDLDALTPPQREEYLQTRLQSVFVEPNVRENPPALEHAEERVRDASKGKPPRRVLDVLVEHDARRMVLLGDPGAGKSTLARFLALSVAAVDGDERLASLRDHLPLLIELRTYAGLQAKGECHTLLEFLERLRETEGLGFEAGTLDRYLRERPVLMILDGLDEVFDPTQRETVARQIAGFASTYPKARLLVTSRITGYRHGTLTDAGFVHHTLQDLDDDQIGQFLTSWYTIALQDRPDEARRRRQQLQAAIAASRPIRELAGNPLLLTILAIIGRQQRLPRERWKVYDHAATVLVEHWDVDRHLQQQGRPIEAEFLDENDKKELLRRIAYRMQAAADPWRLPPQPGAAHRRRRLVGDRLRG